MPPTDFAGNFIRPLLDTTKILVEHDVVDKTTEYVSSLAYRPPTCDFKSNTLKFHIAHSECLLRIID